MKKISKSTLAFVKAVMSPIMADEPAQVPDLESSDTLCLTDYNEVSRPLNNNAASAPGLLVWLRAHESTVYTNLVSPGGLVYSVCYAFCDANGLLLPNTATGKFDEYVPSNILTIQGGSTITPNSALVTGLRVFAMGLRILPTVEFVTDTSVTYVVRFTGGQISMQELGSCYANSANVETIIRNSSCAETFANNEGVCSRYNPFQNENQLRMQNLEDCLNTAQSFSFHKMPAIFMRFSANIASGSAAPIIIHARYWLEGVLRKPSPIYAQQSPIDLDYPQIRATLSGCHPEFPLVTKGHSFPAIAQVALAAVKVINEVSGAVLYYTGNNKNKYQEMGRYKKQFNYYTDEMRASYQVRNGRKKPKKKKKKQQANDRRPGQQSYRIARQPKNV